MRWSTTIRSARAPKHWQRRSPRSPAARHVASNSPRSSSPTISGDGHHCRVVRSGRSARPDGGTATSTVDTTTSTGCLTNPSWRPRFPTGFVGYSLSSPGRRLPGVRQSEPTSLTGASSWPSASATPHPTSPHRPRRGTSVSTSGSATRGACCSATPRTSPRSARPSSATSPRSSPSSTSATSR